MAVRKPSSVGDLGVMAHCFSLITAPTGWPAPWAAAVMQPYQLGGLEGTAGRSGGCGNIHPCRAREKEREESLPTPATRGRLRVRGGPVKSSKGRADPSSPGPGGRAARAGRAGHRRCRDCCSGTSTAVAALADRLTENPHPPRGRELGLPSPEPWPPRP
jgi:hypothetical protein